MAKSNFQVYPNLIFPEIPNRPLFYSNFVQTVDGKVQVLTKNQDEYWPIGSPTDYHGLLELRAYADVLIHGGTTAKGHSTIQSLIKEEFKKLRKEVGKEKDIVYIILTRHIESIIDYLKNPPIPVIIVTANTKVNIKHAYKNITIEKAGEDSIDIKKLASFLHQKGFKNILVEGGPKTLASFFAQDLIDEVFITIAPKIFGNENKKTITMVEGILFEPNNIKRLKLLSLKQIKDEVYLRYKMVR